MERQPSSLVRAFLGGVGVAAVFVAGVVVGAGQRDAEAQVLREKRLSLSKRVARLEALLANFSRQGRDVYITGANLHVLNGMGNTDTKNGLGNLILGYNELRENDPNDRSGSHNLVVGKKNGYSSTGGVVFGLYNNSVGAYSTVLGGAGNRARASGAVVAGGRDNDVVGSFAAVSGGHFNEASGENSVVSGGLQHRVTGQDDWRAGSLFEEQ